MDFSKQELTEEEEIREELRKEIKQEEKRKYYLVAWHRVIERLKVESPAVSALLVEREVNFFKKKIAIILPYESNFACLNLNNPTSKKAIIKACRGECLDVDDVLILQGVV